MAKKPNSRNVKLQAELKRAHTAATRKISRIKTNTQAIISGSEFDPRIPLSQTKSMTAAELRSQIANLKGFTARDVQFVPDAHFKPLPRNEWRDFEQAQSVYNQHAAAEMAAVGPIVLPSGETIAQRRAKMRSDHRTAGNPSVHAPNEPSTLKPTNIKNRAALKKLTDDMRRKLSPDYDAKELERGMGELRQILDAIKSPELEADIAALNNRQLNILWNYTSFANDASLWYEMVQQSLQDNEKDYHSEVIEQKFRQAKKLVKDAKNW